MIELFYTYLLINVHFLNALEHKKGILIEGNQNAEKWLERQGIITNRRAGVNTSQNFPKHHPAQWWINNQK